MKKTTRRNFNPHILYPTAEKPKLHSTSLLFNLCKGNITEKSFSEIPIVTKIDILESLGHENYTINKVDEILQNSKEIISNQFGFAFLRTVKQANEMHGNHVVLSQVIRPVLLKSQIAEPA